MNAETAFEKEIMVRYGEMFLKSEPVRKRHELILENNIKNALAKEGIEPNVYRKRLRLFVKAEETEKACGILKKVPGIVSFSPCMHIKGSELEVLKNFCRAKFEGWIAKEESFAVRVNRNGSQPYSGRDAERELGSVIDRKVNLDKPDRTLSVEISDNDSYICTETTRGIGGLPVGSAGKIAVLLSGGIDSPVAAFFMVRRGCRALFIHFHSFPLVSRKSIEKAKELVKILNGFQMKSTLILVPFADLQMKIKTKAEQKYRVILYRRSMLRIAEKISKEEGIIALATGESLAQVSSQTLDNLAVTSEATGLPILRPLIGMDKEEIISAAKSIGTYETSIQPHEDCCTLFVPKHASAKVDLNAIKKIEKGLKLSALENSAVKNAESVEIK